MIRMITDALGIGAVIVGGGLIVGATIAVIGKEAIQKDQTILDKAEISVVRIGFVTEGMVKGAIISAPISIMALLAVNYGLKAQKKVVGGI